jgi:8-oxo-dGTP pyrophosphatase MutT (NUDIX family)
MNNKIYFNDKFILVDTKAIETSENQFIKTIDFSDATQLKESVFNFLTEKNVDPIRIKAKDLESVLALLKSMFYYIEAAGGFIEKKKEFLFIHRHNRWDLPKGKLEKNEETEDAAIRECEEETGVRQLKIVRRLSSTFHLYVYKNGYALKQTFWFYMTSDFSKKLTPQVEEDIDEVRWFNKAAILSEVKPDTYHTITDVINEALTLHR